MKQLWALRKKPSSFILRLLVLLSAAGTAGIILFLIGYILVMGIPHLSLDLFSFEYTSDNVSLMPALINTLLMTPLALLVAGPVGIFAAVYLVEYASRGNPVVKAVRLAAETLSAIPSIVYGLFGMLFFGVALGWKFSLLGGSLTLAIMVLPLIMRTTEEALLSVPDSYRSGSFALGAGRLRTIFSIVLPAAVPGILAGVILAIGRIVGESAALIFTAGTVPELPESFFSSTRTLSVHMYVLSSEGLHIDQAYATAVVLLGMVVLINALSGLIAKKVVGGRNE